MFRSESKSVVKCPSECRGVVESSGDGVEAKRISERSEWSDLEAVSSERGAKLGQHPVRVESTSSQG